MWSSCWPGKRMAAQVAEFQVESLGARGDGVCHDGKGTVYIPYGAPGDRLEATITGQRGAARVARLDRVLAPGPDRVTPPCPHFGLCGGCAVQHLNDRAYGRWKLDILRHALNRRGLEDVPIGEMIVIPPASRRRARFSARHRRKGIQLGFNAPGSHDIVDVRSCQILLPDIVNALDDIRELLSDLLPRGGTADVQVTATETGLDVWLVVDIPHGAQTDMRLAEFAQTADLSRLSTGRQPDVVMVRRAPRVTFDGVAVTPPPDGFLQASLAGERALTELVRRGVGRAGKVADLFAGIGTFSFPLGNGADVLAVEGQVEQAQALTKGRNAARRGRIEVQVRDLERRPLSVAELRPFEAVVFDPPRAGARNQAAALAASAVPVVVAVSCNPATFARDALALVEGGYRLIWLVPVDQFPWSRHLELVACFER